MVKRYNQLRQNLPYPNEMKKPVITKDTTMFSPDYASFLYLILTGVVSATLFLKFSS